ncbi:MAG: hypothetical protein M1822_000975 [Bathelium mastoideum]|nr:MAG: hypothetical protein M1822_000975 [Bathelium mastoideum]
MPQLQEVGLLRPRKVTFANTRRQRQSRFLLHQCTPHVERTDKPLAFPNSHCTESSKKNNNEAKPAHRPSLTYATSQNGRAPPASSLHDSNVNASTPSNIGRRRRHAASLLASPPRAGHSVKVSKIFQDAHTNLVTASRKEFSFQGSPALQLSTSKHRRAFGSQHPPLASCSQFPTHGTSEQRGLMNIAPSQLASAPRLFVELDCPHQDASNPQFVLEQSKVRPEGMKSLALMDAINIDKHTPLHSDAATKDKIKGDSPQIPPLEPLGDLFKDVVDLMSPPPSAPSYDKPTKHPVSAVPPEALLARENAVYSPTGTWSDDHIFYPRSSKGRRIPQSPLSQSWTDDSKFYHSPTPITQSSPERTTTRSNAEIVMTWLDRINLIPGEAPYSPTPVQQCDIDRSLVDNLATNTTCEAASREAGGATVQAPSSPALSLHATPPPKFRRWDSTHSLPPCVMADAHSPPLSPLSPDVELARGSRRWRQRSRRASYYDTDILQMQQELKLKEERCKARLEKYGC